jgi:hypothetical protein
MHSHIAIWPNQPHAFARLRVERFRDRLPLLLVILCFDGEIEDLAFFIILDSLPGK